MTALTVGTNATASTTLTTANTLASTIATSTTNTLKTQIGTAAGWGEVVAQGTTNAWAAGASEPGSSGYGFLWDVTTLEGQQFVAGNWAASIKIRVTINTVVADVHCRAYKRSSSGAYTLIAEQTFSALTIGTATGSQNSAGSVTVTGSATTFGTGDKLYCDVVVNITTANTSATALLEIYESNVASQGDTSQMGWVTPGYTASGTPLSSSSTAQTTVVDALSVAMPLTGSATDFATSAGALSAAMPFQSVATGQVITSGSLAVAMPLQKTIVAQATAQGTLGTAIPLQGSISTQATVSDALSVAIPLAESSTTQTTVTGTLSIGVSAVAGSALDQAVVTGALSVAMPLAGSVSNQATITGSLAVPSTYRSTVLGDAPLAYYLLNETSGTIAADSSGNGYAGTITGGVTLTTSGPVLAYPSMTLDGSTGYIALPIGLNPAGLSAFSMEAWVLLSNTTFTNNPRFIANEHTDQTDKGIQLYVPAGAAKIHGMAGLGTVYADADDPSAVSANTWYHLVYTYDGTTPRFYVDGTLVNSGGTNSGTIASSTYPINIGRNPAYAGDYAPAACSNVALYASVLSASRISAHYTAMYATPLRTVATAQMTIQGTLASISNGVLSGSSTAQMTTGIVRARALPAVWAVAAQTVAPVSLSVAMPLAGSSTAQMTAQGTVMLALAGSITGQTTAQGTLGTSIPLRGTTGDQSTATGALSATTPPVFVTSVAMGTLVALGTLTPIVNGVFIVSGRGLLNLQNYTGYLFRNQLTVQSQQGGQLDRCTCQLHDPLSTLVIHAEDDILLLDASDPAGLPTVNFLLTPSFEGTYSSGVAPNWSSGNTGTGITYASSATALYGIASQSLALANAASGIHLQISQYVQLATTDLGASIQIIPYTFSIYLNVVTAFAGTGGSTLRIDWYNGGTLLSTTSLSLDSTLMRAHAWQRYAVTGTPPTTATRAMCTLDIVTTSATNSGTILLDGAQCEPHTFGDVTLLNGKTVEQNGLYPSAFTAPGTTGIFVDLTSFVHYRHMRIFGGYVRTQHHNFTQGPEKILTLDAVEYGVLLQEAPVTIVIENQQDSAAIAAAVTYSRSIDSSVLPGMDTSTFVASLTLISGFTITWQSVHDVLDAIASQTIAAFWVDPYKRLHYQSALAISAPFGFSDQPDMLSTFPFANLQYDQDSTQSMGIEVVEGGMQLSAPQTYNATGNGTTTVYQVNGGNAITQIGSCTVAGVIQIIGLLNVNTYVQGNSVLVDLSTGTITFQAAPASAAAIVVTYQFNFPVLMRVRNQNTAIGRPIHHHSLYSHITSQQSALDNAAANLATNAKARPIGKMVFRSPPAPIATPITVGMAVMVTHAAAHFNQLFQVQGVRTSLHGTEIWRELDLGFYRPNLIVQLAQARWKAISGSTNATSSTPLNDVQTATDGWAVSDSIIGTRSNDGTWGGVGSTWGGTTVWG